MSARFDRRRREYDEDADFDSNNRPRVTYRKPSSAEAKALFANTQPADDEPRLRG